MTTPLDTLAFAIQNGHFESGRGATSDEIKAAESALHCSFPEAYRSFLARFGWLDGAMFSIFGAGQDVPTHLEIVRMTYEERTLCRPYIPGHLVPFCNDGAGNHSCIDLHAAAAHQDHIVLWCHEFDESQCPYTVARDFSDWLVDHLKLIEDDVY